MFGTGLPQGTSFNALLVTLAVWLLLACAAWVAAIATAALVEAASRGRLPATTWVGCPRPLRRLLLGGLGAALAATPAPALATGLSLEQRGSVAGPALPVPARTLGQAAAPPTQRVEVRAGDCLWHLARARLPEGAAPARIAALAAATYRLNRDVIGDDPDLIRPGQQLVLPHPTQHPRPEETP